MPSSASGRGRSFTGFLNNSLEESSKACSTEVAARASSIRNLSSFSSTSTQENKDSRNRRTVPEPGQEGVIALSAQAALAVHLVAQRDLSHNCPNGIDVHAPDTGPVQGRTQRLDWKAAFAMSKHARSLIANLVAASHSSLSTAKRKNAPESFGEVSASD